MTADTTSFTRLRCDKPGCPREFPDNAPLQAGAAFTRRRAAESGWTRDWDMDLCPDHDAAAVFDLNPQGRIA